jgi:hypothetical protein
MGLLRNASGLMIPDSTGRLGRADDPEFHIRRLNHFGQGMGIDLSSTHPQFSNKRLGSWEGYDEEDLDFDSHDEGLQLPQGHMDAAVEALWNNRALNGELRTRGNNELYHRSPYTHNFTSSIPRTPNGPSHIEGTIHKDVSDPTKLEHSYLLSFINGEHSTFHDPSDTVHDNHKDAMQAISSRFQEFNRNRQGTRADVSALVSDSINNPNQSHMQQRRRTPSLFSSQFLKVGHYPQHSDDFGVLEDNIDLKTGNWAKIDPEGYFPD